MTLDQQFDALSDKEALRFIDRALDRFNWSYGHDAVENGLERIAQDVADMTGFANADAVMGWGKAPIMGFEQAPCGAIHFGEGRGA